MGAMVTATSSPAARAAAVGVAVHDGDAEDIDGVDEMVDDTVLALDVDDDLATGGGKGVIAEGGVQVIRGGVSPDGGGLLLAGGGGEGEVGLLEGSEGGEGSSWGGTTRASGGGRRHRWTSLHQKQGQVRMLMPASRPRQLLWRCMFGSQHRCSPWVVLLHHCIAVTGAPPMPGMWSMRRSEEKSTEERRG